MAPAFPTTLLHQASTSFRFPAGAAGCIRPHCLAPLAAPTTLSLAATPAVPRRLLLPVAAGIWDLISGGAGAAAAASLAVRRGMQLFRQGDVAGSLAEFDKAIEMDPRQKQYLWQRGLSLYYLDRCVGLDSRPVMREAYALLRSGADPEKLVAKFSSGTDGEVFYSSLYAGLYYESQVWSPLAVVDNEGKYYIGSCRGR
ncbi:hypothetical protein Zm00014a_041957 [Zea mays]|uniref:Uncharacterized protein n=1 Tax=Zea mays TaxID=4577 RepID=A0A3L6DRU0_MAIZE|nr:hypothetical protein Zm00014a_041957 [Zea mays]